jgi:hypothetical protein
MGFRGVEWGLEDKAVSAECRDGGAQQQSGSVAKDGERGGGLGDGEN